MKSNIIYEIQDLKSARDFLTKATKQIILSNPQGSTRYYGMRVIDRVFRTLKQEFPHKIGGILVNAYDDYPAFITAKKLGYQQIQYEEN